MLALYSSRRLLRLIYIIPQKHTHQASFRKDTYRQLPLCRAARVTHEAACRATVYVRRFSAYICHGAVVYREFSGFDFDFIYFNFSWKTCSISARLYASMMREYECFYDYVRA